MLGIVCFVLGIVRNQCQLFSVICLKKLKKFRNGRYQIFFNILFRWRSVFLYNSFDRKISNSISFFCFSLHFCTWPHKNIFKLNNCYLARNANFISIFIRLSGCSISICAKIEERLEGDFKPRTCMTNICKTNVWFLSIHYHVRSTPTFRNFKL